MGRDAEAITSSQCGLAAPDRTCRWLVDGWLERILRATPGDLNANLLAEAPPETPVGKRTWFPNPTTRRSERPFIAAQATLSVPWERTDLFLSMGRTAKTATSEEVA